MEIPANGSRRSASGGARCRRKRANFCASGRAKNRNRRITGKAGRRNAPSSTNSVTRAAAPAIRSHTLSTTLPGVRMKAPSGPPCGFGTMTFGHPPSQRHAVHRVPNHRMGEPLRRRKCALISSALLSAAYSVLTIRELKTSKVVSHWDGVGAVGKWPAAATATSLAAAGHLSTAVVIADLR